MLDSMQEKPNFVFITGGVLSGIGKGVTTASIAKLFQFRGYNIRIIKIDPYLNKMDEKALKVSAFDSTGRIINAIELTDHPFWIGVQYHPEFKSRPDNPHPLYLGLIRAALEYNKERVKK